METLFLVSIRMKGPGRGHLWPAQVQLEPRSTEPPEPPLCQAGLTHTYLVPAGAPCVGVAVCLGSSSSPRFRVGCPWSLRPSSSAHGQATSSVSQEVPRC